jgi:hypothetical protein
MSSNVSGLTATTADVTATLRVRPTRNGSSGAALPRWCRRFVTLATATAGLVLGARSVQTQQSVGATAHDGTVVVVLPIIFPAALRANVVPAALGERPMPATRTGERTALTSGNDVPLARVVLEPSSTLSDQFVVAQ